MGRLKTTNEFINDSKNIFGDRYDYSLVKYIGNKINVNLICGIHGTFGIRPDVHLSMKSACPYCGNAVRKTKDEFIKRSIYLHGDIYDYSLTRYINNNVKVKIICKIHGVFEQKPLNHYRYGCIKCGGTYSYDTIEFIRKAKEVHGERYVYINTNYISVKHKVEIICREHGSFFQNPNNHVRLRNGCPNCLKSKGECKIEELLKNINIIFISEKKFDLMKSNISVFMAYDFYLPDYNLCIEFDGKQHFESIQYFGGLEEFERIKKRDDIKNKFCFENNINLLRIPYWDYDNIETIINNKIDELKNNNKI